MIGDKDRMLYALPVAFIASPNITPKPHLTSHKLENQTAVASPSTIC